MFLILLISSPLLWYKVILLSELRRKYELKIHVESCHEGVRETYSLHSLELDRKNLICQSEDSFGKSNLDFKASVDSVSPAKVQLLLV